EQARLVQQALEEKGDWRVFVAMRYSPPRAREVVAAVKARGFSHIVLVPLYPQFSSTTTASSVTEWQREAKVQKLDRPTSVVCCYPSNRGFIAAHADLLATALRDVPAGQNVRVLFSAHGLPQRIVERGDPYVWQVEETVKAVVEQLGRPIDWAICYQSRV